MSDAHIYQFKGMMDCGPPRDPARLRDIERICEAGGEGAHRREMKRVFFIALLFLSSEPAYAEWVAVATNVDDYTIYINPETIRRKGDIVEVGLIFDSRLAKRYQDTTFYLSTRHLQQYDCVEERFRLLALTIYSDNMGKGTVIKDVVTEDPWTPIPPGSVGRNVMGFVCDR